jgi:DNA-binding NtrC family response regulator
MPKMTGKQLAQKISETGTNIPIILTTGLASEAAAHAAQPGVFAASLPKPVQFRELANTLRRVLDETAKG